MSLSRRSLIAALFGAAACESPVEPSPAELPRRLAVGEATVCALDPAGTVLCWGANGASWEYGAEATAFAPSASPVAVPVPALVKLGGGSSQHMCGLTSTDEAICWGRGDFGQIGGASVGNAGNAARPVKPGNRWADIFVSRLSTCAVSLTRKAFCWGSNQRGEIGDTLVALAARTSEPRLVLGGIEFTSIVAGWLHACGIAISGATYCWGDNSAGQLGIGFADGSVHPSPLLVSFTETFVQLSLAARSTCGITPDHRALCWGRNTTGQLGDGTTVERHFPSPVAGGHKFVRIAMSSGFGGGTTVAPPTTLQGSTGHTCALTESDVPYCWGWNGAGQVGDGTTATRLSPVAVQGTLQLKMLGLGGSSSCGMRDNGIWCWGSNENGQLGNGSSVNATAPVSVSGPFSKP